MPRTLHGEPFVLNPNDMLSARNVGGEPALELAAVASNRWPFGYLFPELAQDDSKLLPEASKTADDLRELGKEENMAEGVSLTGESKPDFPMGIPIPTIYTFFGQFVDHDTTLEEVTTVTDLSDPNLTPLPYSYIVKTIKSSRTPNLDLDSVYGSDTNEDAPPRDPDNKFKLGKVEREDTLPEDRKKDSFQDLYRGEPDRVDRTAMIGDPRNDENLILAQLHVAFMRAHNKLIGLGHNFDKAKELLIQHYQWIVLNDFLKRVADPAIVEKVTKANVIFTAQTREQLFMPLEFSAAAYRFGHSKVRQIYPFKLPGGATTASLEELFRFTRFSGTPNFGLQIPGFWVVEWENFLNSVDKKFFSRPIDTLLAPGLLNLSRERGEELPPWKKNLAVRNLLRAYLLRIPTGQAVAEAMKKMDPSIVPLTRDEIAKAVTDKQRPVMDAAGFLDRTPLWLYVLIEAKSRNDGHHLGPVGSTIVAETLIGILRYSDYSILSTPGWKPTLGSTTGKFDLEDLLELAGVYDPRR